ncbi:sensor histidine kinase [Motilibacter aurantiacus]|uniref:sensor histidine kinase n=1 Tax=Motilibacter aurantiacus TaxID=2714955 RepID=UPI00140B06D1|nr:ATP-binding protein [Motilibacter aurantiacus]NHC43750.1 HAMP domain-containing protein [Motilibacter aurantiacus]
MRLLARRARRPVASVIARAARPLPLRWRMALLQGGAFLAFGAVVVVVLALLVRASLDVRTPGLVAFLSSGDVLRSPVQLPPAERPFTVRIDRGVAGLRDGTVRDLVTWAAAVIAVGFLASVAVGWALAGRVLAPVERITATARRVGERGRLAERIGLQGPDDELKRLADTFDAMLERLDHAADGQRHFVANASHELRTPLSVTRTLVEVALAAPDASADLRAIGPAVLDSVERSERLIDGLLLLARGEQELARRVPVDLAAVTRAAAAQAAVEARDRSVALTVRAGPAATAGDPVLLERLVSNLLQNAVRHNVDGGSAEVTTGARDGTPCVEVRNTGPLVLPHEVPALFEPFHRGTRRVSGPGPQGSGLGLSIVRAVARAHGGSVEAAAAPGGGLVVRVRLPCGTGPPAPDGGTSPQG